MIETVPVALGTRSYDVKLAAGLLSEAGAHIAPLLKRPKVAIVSDAHVASLHLDALTKSLDAQGISHSNLSLPKAKAQRAGPIFKTSSTGSSQSRSNALMWS